MKTAHYHQANKVPQLLEVLAEHPDGTVDLGRNGEVVVSKCRVTEQGEAGCATRVANESAAAAAGKTEDAKGEKDKDKDKGKEGDKTAK